MSYLARLKAATSANTVTIGTDKADKSPFVSSVGTQSGRISGFVEVPSAQYDELCHLIACVLEQDTEADRTEALAVALADPEAALTSFWALLADLQTVQVAFDPDDDRRPCTACANLTSRDHRCLAAWRGERPGNAARDYHPAIDIPRCCECYLPIVREVDQRPGAERWPSLLRPIPRI
jgi:hypothetical protein